MIGKIVVIFAVVIGAALLFSAGGEDISEVVCVDDGTVPVWRSTGWECEIISAEAAPIGNVTIKAYSETWAAEASSLNSGVFEWAFGDYGAWNKGKTNIINGTISRMGLSCESAGAAITQVVIYVNEVQTPCNVSLASSVGNGSVSCDVDVYVNDRITFKTLLAGSATRCIANYVVEYDAPVYEIAIKGIYWTDNGTHRILR